MPTFTLRQTTTIVDQTNDAPLYRVINQVMGAIGASPAAFVYKTSDKVFDHVATAGDMERWPDSYEEAVLRGVEFYRLDSVSRTWTSVEDMNADLDIALRRVQRLANDLTARRGILEIDRVTTIEGA